MVARTCDRTGLGIQRKLPLLLTRLWGRTLPALLGLLLWPATGICDLEIAFLVDHSGSMWAAFGEKPKIVQVKEAIERVTQELPPDVAMGLRVYPPPERPGVRREDPGLRIPIERDNRDRFPEELSLLNPKGQGSLREEIAKALGDFPDGEGTKLLALICDGSDTRGISFCETALTLTRPAGLRFFAISLNLKDPADKEELDCLNRQMEGKAIHLAPQDDLVATLLPITRQAYRGEVERQRRLKEEQERMQALLSKTRLKVEFKNTLDPFFADAVQVDQCLIDGEEIPIDSSVRLAQGEGFLLLDRAMAEGTYALSLRYKKWKGEKTVSSVGGILVVQIEAGKTLHVQAYPRGALFRWDIIFRTSNE